MQEALGDRMLSASIPSVECYATSHRSGLCFAKLLTEVRIVNFTARLFLYYSPFHCPLFFLFILICFLFHVSQAARIARAEVICQTIWSPLTFVCSCLSWQGYSNKSFSPPEERMSSFWIQSPSFLCDQKSWRLFYFWNYGLGVWISTYDSFDLSTPINIRWLTSGGLMLS